MVTGYAGSLLQLRYGCAGMQPWPAPMPFGRPVACIPMLQRTSTPSRGCLVRSAARIGLGLNFPARAPEPVEVPGLAEALGVIPLYLGKDADDYMVEVATEAEAALNDAGYSQP